jgi:hypothetical protein
MNLKNKIYAGFFIHSLQKSKSRTVFSNKKNEAASLNTLAVIMWRDDYKHLASKLLEKSLKISLNMNLQN